MAKKTKKTKIRPAIEVANDLTEVRARMATDKALNDSLTKEFKAALYNEERKEAGDYHLTTSTTYKVAVEELALPFALLRNLVKVDTSKVRAVFRLDSELRAMDPAKFGFEVVTQEKVTPKGGKGDEE